MSDFQKPIERFESDQSKDWLVPPAQRIDKDKKGKEEIQAKELKPEEAKNLMLAILTTYCKKFLELFTSKEKISLILVDLQQIFLNLQNLKKMFQALGNEDKSQSPAFILELSELWLKLLDDCRRVEAFEKEAPEIAPKLRAIVEKVDHYPPGADHSLGYYLQEHVGKDWLPFPFMEILLNLHQQHTQNPQKSPIPSWLSLIDEAISSLALKKSLL